MVPPSPTPADADSRGPQVRVLAVADSDSYVKWACATLDAVAVRPGTPVDRRVVIVRSPLAPTTAQTAAAVAGTSMPSPPVVGLGALRQEIRQRRPDVVVVAATGAVAELVARTVVRAAGRHRPALVAGLPGMALPATAAGVCWRRWADAFVVHSHREAREYYRAFAAQGASPRLVLSRLPFLSPGSLRKTEPPHRIVFAPQSIVPASPQARTHLLDGLAQSAREGFEVVVKLRARVGERQTHNEELPLDQLWQSVHSELGHPESALRFEVGPMADWLTPGTAVVTVSSTAALESLSRGLPTVLVDDFGISPRLLNEPFVGSGCLGSLQDLPSLLRSGGPEVDATWAQDNYLHDEPSEIDAALDALTIRRRAGDLVEIGSVRPCSWPRYLRTTLRSALPSRLARRLARRVR